MDEIKICSFVPLSLLLFSLFRSVGGTNYEVLQNIPLYLHIYASYVSFYYVDKIKTRTMFTTALLNNIEY